MIAKLLKNLFAVVVVASGISACGLDREDDSSLLSDEQNAERLFIINGGKNGCRDSDLGPAPIGQGVEVEFRSVRATLEDLDYPVRYILTCYEGGDPEVWFQVSDLPGELFELNRGAYQTFAEDWVTDARDEQPLARQPVVSVVGFSYGGWLSLKSILETDINPELNFALDPISRERCGFGSPTGCRSFPPDLAPDADEIAAKSGRFIHFYQLETSFLHSTPIPEADENFQIFVGHTALDSSDQVWDRILHSAISGH